MFPKDSNTYLSLRVASSQLTEWRVDERIRTDFTRERERERETAGIYLFFLPASLFFFLSVIVVVVGLVIGAVFEALQRDNNRLSHFRSTTHSKLDGTSVISAVALIKSRSAVRPLE